MSWRPTTWPDSTPSTSDEEKLKSLIDLVHEELEYYPGDEVMRILNKILDILTG